MNKSWHKKWWGILLIIIITFILIILIASGFYVYSMVKIIKNNPEQALFNNIASKENAKKRELVEGGDNYWIGSANPKITIVEFADFACPFSKKSFSKIREITEKYKNDIKLIYRNLPLHENSLAMSLAGRCAGEQGLFWLMHDKLFQNQKVNTQSQLTELANQIGADTEKFQNCLSTKKYLTQIQKDFALAQELKLPGTPTWFINGYQISGDIPYSAWKEIMKHLISSRGEKNHKPPTINDTLYITPSKF